LKPAFKNKFEAKLNSYKVVSSRYVYVFATYSFASNPIAMSRKTDADGKSIYQSVNINDRRTSGFFMSTHYGKKIEALGCNVGVWLDLSRGINYNVVNDVLNKLETRYIASGIRAYKDVEKKYSLWIYMGPRYNFYKTTLPTMLNNNGGGIKSSSGFRVQLPGKLEISTDIEYNHTNSTQAYSDDVDYFIMNSSLTKKFFKDEKLRFSVSGNDLLNQNRGFNRTANDNFLTQSSYTTINRYLLFSLIWDFNKMGGGLKPKN
jgi:hypothetical protein